MKKQIWTVMSAFALLVLVATAASANPSLAVNTQSALGGTNFGLQVSIDNNAASTFVSSDHPEAETHFLLRFRLDTAGMNVPTGTSGGPNSYFRIAHLIKSGDGAHVILFMQRVPGTGNMHLIAWSKESSGANNFRFVGGFFFSAHGASTANNQIECEWTQATSGTANDGKLRCVKVGTGNQFNVTNLDNFNTVIDQARYGFFNFDTFTGTGSYKFDEYESYR